MMLTRGITLGSLIVLARVVSPTEFGTFAVIAIVVTAATWVGDLGISGALVQQRSDPSKPEMAAAWTAQQLIAASITTGLWILAPLISNLAGLGAEGRDQIRVMSLGVVLTGLARLPFAMLTRVLRFSALARLEVLQVAANYLAATPLAISGLGVWSLVLGSVAQAAVAALLSNVAWRSWPGATRDLRPTRRMLAFGTQAT